MKKIVSIALIFIIATSLTIPAFADTGCNCGINPVVFVHGFGSYSLYEYSDKGESTQVFPPNAQSIIKSVPTICDLLMNLTVTKNHKRSADEFIKVLDNLMGRLACDKKGNSLYNVGIEKRELPTSDHHKITEYSFDTQSEKINTTSQYSYYYDFRLDPVENAEGLNEYIKYVKKLTNHKKVSLVCHSQGNTVVLSYLAKYCNNDISDVLFLSPAYRGLSLIGELFNSDLNIRGKSDELELYFKGILGFSPSKAIISALISILNDCGVMPYVTRILQDMLDEEFGYILDTELLKVFGTMPAIWSFCPDEYYESGKKNLFGNSKEYAGLIKKIDYYHYNIQNRLVQILNNCRAKGMKFSIICGYDVSTIPISDNPQGQTDMLIDTKYMSIGANCAPAGEMFPENYTQKRYPGKNYISPDRKIDASTCLYPDRTWFIKGQLHDDFYDAYTKFLTSLLLFKGQPTIYNLSGYTQFMTYDRNMNLVPVANAGYKQTKDVKSSIPGIFDEFIIPDRIKIFAK